MPPPDTIPVALPTLGEEEERNVVRVLRSKWITQGPEVAAFEREFADYVDAPYACAVANCTVGLHLALLGVGVSPGDDVITVSHSYIATANSVRYCGANPIFVDVDPATYNIDVGAIEAAVTPKVKAILCVHQLGMPCDLKRILAVAERHGLSIVEDAACAIGSIIRIDGEWQKIGKPHGRVACFSFHPRKLLTTGDGGMIVTADAELDRKFRLWRQHGMSVTDVQRHASRAVVFEEYAVLGYNYRMTDLQAAVGRAQLKRIDEMVRRRRRLVDRYRNLLHGIQGIQVPQEPEWAQSNWQSFCILLPGGVSQKAVMQRMLDDGVSTRRGVMNAHREKPYNHLQFRLPGGEIAQDRGIILPLYDQMDDVTQERVVQSLANALAGERRDAGE